MVNPSRQTPALVAMGLALTLGFWSFASSHAQPTSAYPAVPVSQASTECSSAPCSPPSSPPQSREADSRLDRHRAGDRSAQAAESSESSESSAPPASSAAPVPPVPTVVVGGVTGVTGIVWPVNAPLTSAFGIRFHPVLHVVKLHTGMDLGASCGTPVAAALGGVVTYSGVDRAYGGRVVVDHGIINGRRLATTYSHLSGLGVRVGQSVVAGAGIGLVGTTGFSTGCHLHVELLVDGAFVDPAPWFRNGTIGSAAMGTVVPVAQVADPIPEPEVPNETTTPILPEPPVVPTPSGSASPSGSVTPDPSGSGSPEPSDPTTPEPSVTPSPSATASASTTPDPEPTSTPSASQSPTTTPTTAPPTSAPATSSPPPTTSAPAQTTPPATPPTTAPTTQPAAPSGESSGG